MIRIFKNLYYNKLSKEERQYFIYYETFWKLIFTLISVTQLGQASSNIVHKMAAKEKYSCPYHNMQA